MITISPVNSVLGVALAVGADDATRRSVTRPAATGTNHHSAICPWIHLDLADSALELGKRRRLAIAILHDLNLARVDELRESRAR